MDDSSTQGAEMDGLYEIRFSADGYEGEGQATISRGAFQGSDSIFHLSGSVHETRGHITANVAVSVTGRAAANSKIDHDFSTRMTGTVTTEGFYLVGTGPLGLIVQIESKGGPK